MDTTLHQATVEALGAINLSPLDEVSMRIVAEAAAYIPVENPNEPISTTRLFLGALDTKDFPTSGAFTVAVEGYPRLMPAIRVLRRLYERNSQMTSQGLAAGFSPNAAQVLSRAANAVESGTDAAIIPALLDTPKARVWTRLERDGVERAYLKLLFEKTLESWPELPKAPYGQDPTPGPVDTAPDPPISFVTGIANDDPWYSGAVDRMGVAPEANAFARLALFKGFEPPLAVGVFGDWGSGKTFFMRQVFKAVEEITTAEAAPECFHTDAVQIRFNAWHYVETNLWASLVDHVFNELDRWIAARTSGARDANELLSRLETARRLTLEAAQVLVDRRREQKRATEKLEAAERQLAEARAKATVQPADVLKSFKEVFTREFQDVNHVRDKALRETGLHALGNDAQAFRVALTSLTDEGRRGGVLVRQMLGQLGSVKWLALVLAAVVVAPAVPVLLKDWVRWLPLEHVSNDVLALSGLLAGLAATMNRLVAAVKPTLDQLSALRARLEAKLEESLARDTKARADAEVEAASKSAAVERARGELEAATRALASVVEEYAAETGFRRLRRFVQGRATDGTYARHLGLVATIRKDFEQLSSLMLDEVSDADTTTLREHHARQVDSLLQAAGDLLDDGERDTLRKSAEPAADLDAAQKGQFKRILLYIDDLDRCPPPKVVEVLQAVHMLLTFPLFVVFVAVDARWVTRALQQEYPQLLDDSPRAANGNGAGPGVSSATPHDYLEKIFQIPYWVRPLSETGSRDLLGDLLNRGALANVRGRAPAPPVEERADPAVSPAATDAPAQPAGIAGGNAAANAAATPTATATATPTATATAAAVIEALELSDEERSFMAQLAPFAGSSPRRLVRFVNVYRVIKASMPRATSEELRRSGEYLALLTQLAIVTGAPLLLEGWLALEGKGSPKTANADSIANLVAALEADQGFGGVANALGMVAWRNLRGALQTYATSSDSDPAVPAVPRLRTFSPIARRYSFIG